MSYTYFTLLRTQKVHTSAYNTLIFTVSFRVRDRVNNRVRVSFQRYIAPEIELYAAGGRSDFPRWSALPNCLCPTTIRVGYGRPMLCVWSWSPYQVEDRSIAMIESVLYNDALQKDRPKGKGSV